MVKISAWNRNQNRVSYLSIIICIHVCTRGIIWNDCKELFLFIRVSMSLLYYDNTFFFEYFNLLVIDISVDRKNLKILMKFNPGFFFNMSIFRRILLVSFNEGAFSKCINLWLVNFTVGSLIPWKAFLCAIC